ncbi:MAG TPA: phosphoenolpyruvate carboxykinase (ATP) [Gemmataceae bacterium]|nr:phosphoenolpyruvate carboxykinase (ATP) [Gemmataceae bacterium]
MAPDPMTQARQFTAADAELAALGLQPAGKVHAQLPAAALIELAVQRGEGILTDAGAFAANTGAITGRSPKDRYLIPEAARPDDVWWGPVNRPMDPFVFDRLFDRVRSYLQSRDLFVTDGSACADSRHTLAVRVVADEAWHALLAQRLLRPPIARRPELTIVAAGGAKADPAADGTRSEVFVVLNLDRRIVLIGGTRYAGEIKKSIFSVLNYLLPFGGVFPMHCSANIGPAGDTALFFGLSGTGKTTLSADPGRRLIGDDEHGWSDEGVFNIEGGCYAKTIRLSREQEPQIWNAIRFGAVLENVVVDPRTRRPDFADGRITENTRAAYPADFIAGAEPSGRGGHPRTILFLACDAFGVLPPLSRQTPEQALYHFLSGYTAKVAGTERGVTEPEATFSTCFAAPFLPLHPTRYAALLHERLRTHGATVWLVNTGWTGGGYGQGRRMPLPHTRALVRAALDGSLSGVPTIIDPVFGLAVPQACPGVPAEMLRPRDAWPDAAAYDAQARRLAGLFRDNFRSYAAQATEAVRQAGPREWP